MPPRMSIVQREREASGGQNTPHPADPLEQVVTPERVAAFVVTYRRPEILRTNLAALVSQTHRLDAVIVMNNDPDGRIRNLLWDEFPTVEVVDLSENVGSAGGFARALHLANQCGYTWGWLLDEDSIPEPNALEELMAAAARFRRDGEVIGMLAPMQMSAQGAFGGAMWRHRIVPVSNAQRAGREPFAIDLAYWAGLLVHRSVIGRIGYPRTEFFRCFADYEYCLRSKQAGMKLMAVPTSRVAHHEGLHRTVVRLGRPSVRAGYPPSRHYYDARNAAFTAWHSMRSPLAVAFQFIRQCRLAVGDLLYEDQKLRRVGLRFRGTVDGLLARLGRRSEIE